MAPELFMSDSVCPCFAMNLSESLSQGPYQIALSGEKGTECVKLPCLYIASPQTRLQIVPTPCGTPCRLDTLRPQANVLEIGAPEVSVLGPHLCGHVPMLTIPTPTCVQIAMGRTSSLAW